MEETHTLERGWAMTPSGSPSKSVWYMPAVPGIGVERFYLPQYDLIKKEPTSQGVVEIKSDHALNPEFVGQWAYRTKKSPKGQLSVNGPLQLESKEPSYEIVGRQEKLIQLEPLQFLRMSGDGMIIVEPAEKLDFMGPISFGKMTETLKQMSKVIGYYRYTMLPLDSEDAKAIPIPEILKKEFEKQK